MPLACFDRILLHTVSILASSRALHMSNDSMMMDSGSRNMNDVCAASDFSFLPPASLRKGLDDALPSSVAHA